MGIIDGGIERRGHIGKIDIAPGRKSLFSQGNTVNRGGDGSVSPCCKLFTKSLDACCVQTQNLAFSRFCDGFLLLVTHIVLSRIAEARSMLARVK